MIKLGPRILILIDGDGREVRLEVRFEIDIEIDEKEDIEPRSCVAVISRGESQDVIRAYAQDQLQACHRLMMLSSAYISQVAESEGLRPRLGVLPRESEGFELFRY